MATVVKKLSIISCFYFMPLCIFGQTNQSPGFLPCGADDVHNSQMLSDITYKTRFDALRSQITRYIVDSIQENPNKNESDNNLVVYTIPIVVHVIHLGESPGTGSNISDAQIYSAINGLNDRFRNNIGSGFDVEIQFCLAS